MVDDFSAQASIARRDLTRATEQLLGIVTGIIADQHLHDLEIQMLRHWLKDHQNVASVWPGSAIANRIEDAMADGVITDDERTHLLKTLQDFAVQNFSETGSVHAEVIKLPLDEQSPIDLPGRGVCLTGEFMYGTRAACEKLTEKAGGIPMTNPSKKVSYLVIGTNVSPHWANTSYGRKIERAMALQTEGHQITIVSESRWLTAIRG